jgi:hypothetical protein
LPRRMLIFGSMPRLLQTLILALIAALAFTSSASAISPKTSLRADGKNSLLRVGQNHAYLCETLQQNSFGYGGFASDSPLASRGVATTAFGRSVQSLKNVINTGKGPWRRLTVHAEGATGRAYKDATSIEEVFRHTETGERIIRHTIVRGEEILHETFRTYSKFY